MSLDLNPDLSETLEYNQPGFPFRIMESQLSFFDRFAAECHWHRDFEFLWAEEGSICYFVNGQNVRIRQGEGIFVNSGRLHYGYSPEQAECRFRFVVADPSVLMENAYITAKLLTLERGEDYLLLHPDRLEEREILHRLQQMYNIEILHSEGYEFALLGEFALLLGQLGKLLHPDQQMISERDQRTVKEMVGFINTHIAEKITLEDIASSGAVCQSKCCQLFRTYVGRSPAQYLQRVRIARSMELLKKEEKSITEIALECGFGSSSYYVAVFRQITGTTPRAFRKGNMVLGDNFEENRHTK